MLTLAMAALLLSLIPNFSHWPNWFAHGWWALWMLVVAIVVGARMVRCPRCGATSSPDAGSCAGCGVSLDEPYTVRSRT